MSVALDVPMTSSMAGPREQDDEDFSLPWYYEPGDVLLVYESPSPYFPQWIAETPYGPVCRACRMDDGIPCNHTFSSELDAMRAFNAASEARLVRREGLLAQGGDPPKLDPVLAAHLQSQFESRMRYGGVVGLGRRVRDGHRRWRYGA